MELFDRTQKHLKENRENVLNGNINSIPSPFESFREDFIGLERSTYYTITSFSKGGKTQFTLYWLFETLLYSINNGNVSLKVFYFPLEEDDEKILLRFESYLLYKLNKIRVSPRDLKSTVVGKPVSQDILNLLESDEYQFYIKAFEKHFEFNKMYNPTGIYKTVKQYVQNHGKVFYKTIPQKDDFGENKKIFDYYVPDNPNEFVVVVVDHISLKTRRFI